MVTTFVAYRKSDGVAVVGKRYKGEIVPSTYANRTQAQKSAAITGGRVVQKGRPWYVELPMPPKCKECDETWKAYE